MQGKKVTVDRISALRRDKVSSAGNCNASCNSNMERAIRWHLIERGRATLDFPLSGTYAAARAAARS